MDILSLLILETTTQGSCLTSQWLYFCGLDNVALGITVISSCVYTSFCDSKIGAKSVDIDLLRLIGRSSEGYLMVCTGKVIGHGLHFISSWILSLAPQFTCLDIIIIIDLLNHLLL